MIDKINKFKYHATPNEQKLKRFIDEIVANIRNMGGK